ncbi:hypothetical protein AAVH_16098 [Aphelenchoides avenae]|nr:hypothetical protein AAVH_16098 [Aphelenchus avenae]
MIKALKNLIPKQSRPKRKESLRPCAVVLTADVLIDVLQCLPRDELDTLEVTSGLFGGTIRRAPTQMPVRKLDLAELRRRGRARLSDDGRIIYAGNVRCIGEWLRRLNHCNIGKLHVKYDSLSRFMWADFKRDLIEFLSGPSYIRAAEVEFSTSKKEACFSTQLYGAMVASGALPEDMKGSFHHFYESMQLRLPSELQTDAGVRIMTALLDAPSECTLPSVILTFDHKFPKVMMLKGNSSKEVTLCGVPYNATVNVLDEWPFSFVLYTPHESSTATRHIRIVAKLSEGGLTEKDREWFRHMASLYAQDDCTTYNRHRKTLQMLFTDETGEMILEKAAQSIGQWLRHLNNCAIVHMRINISESGRVVLKGFQQALADNRSMGFSLCVTEMEFLSGSKHIHTSALIYGATVNCGSVPETLTEYTGRFLHECLQMRLPLPGEVETAAGIRVLKASMDILADAPLEARLPRVILTFDDSFPSSLAINGTGERSKVVDLYGVRYYASANPVNEWPDYIASSTLPGTPSRNRKPDARIIAKRVQDCRMTNEDRAWFRNAASQYDQNNFIVICVATHHVDVDVLLRITQCV